jgi:cytochrome c-type biogenesis protein CcmE
LKKKLVLGGIIAAAALGLLVYFLFHSSTPYVLTLNQFSENRQQYTDKSVRLEGYVVQDTIDWTSSDYSLKFSLQDKDKKMLVFYKGEKQDENKFIGGIKVMVSGSYRNGVFLADSIIYECPNEYKDK